MGKGIKLDIRVTGRLPGRVSDYMNFIIIFTGERLAHLFKQAGIVNWFEYGSKDYSLFFHLLQPGLKIEL
jgi:hypothetical protein